MPMQETHCVKCREVIEYDSDTCPIPMLCDTCRTVLEELQKRLRDDDTQQNGSSPQVG